MWRIEFGFGLLNGWWFFVSFVIFNLVLMKCFPSHYRTRILKLPDFSSGIFFGIAYAICLNGSLIYSIFVTIKISTAWFYLGLLIFLVSAIFFVNALFHYAHTQPNHPVTTGIYRYSRNPQQIFAAFMWIGVGIATTSYLILGLCILQLILAYPTFKAQEEFCIAKYGAEYLEYMKHVSRYLGRYK